MAASPEVGQGEELVVRHPWVDGVDVVRHRGPLGAANHDATLVPIPCEDGLSGPAPSDRVVAAVFHRQAEVAMKT